MNASAEAMVEGDCENQGYTLISDGCLKNQCAVWLPGGQKPERPKLIKVKRNGGEFWICPVCDASYGPTT